MHMLNHQRHAKVQILQQHRQQHPMTPTATTVHHCLRLVTGPPGLFGTGFPKSRFTLCVTAILLWGLAFCQCLRGWQHGSMHFLDILEGMAAAPRMWLLSCIHRPWQMKLAGHLGICEIVISIPIMSCLVGVDGIFEVGCDLVCVCVRPCHLVEYVCVAHECFPCVCCHMLNSTCRPKRKRLDVTTPVANTALKPLITGGSVANVQRIAAAVVQECGAANVTRSTLFLSKLGSGGRRLNNAERDLHRATQHLPFHVKPVFITILVKD